MQKTPKVFEEGEQIEYGPKTKKMIRNLNQHNRLTPTDLEAKTEDDPEVKPKLKIKSEPKQQSLPSLISSPMDSQDQEMREVSGSDQDSEDYEAYSEQITKRAPRMRKDGPNPRTPPLSFEKALAHLWHRAISHNNQVARRALEFMMEHRIGAHTPRYEAVGFVKGIDISVQNLELRNQLLMFFSEIGIGRLSD